MTVLTLQRHCSKMQCLKRMKIYKFADICVEECSDHQDTATTLHVPESLFTNPAIGVHIGIVIAKILNN